MYSGRAELLADSSASSLGLVPDRKRCRSAWHEGSSATSKVSGADRVTLLGKVLAEAGDAAHSSRKVAVYPSLQAIATGALTPRPR